MIFVTVGSDLPFDRLVKTVDRWAQKRGRSDVFAQIGNTEFKPSHIPYVRFLEPAEFTRRVSAASLIVSHAGMGTILTSLRWQKPVLVVPRRTALNEVRNEHQLATAHHLSKAGKIIVALDERELVERLDSLSAFNAPAAIGPDASPQLIAALSAFIHKGLVPSAPAGAQATLA